MFSIFFVNNSLICVCVCVFELEMDGRVCLRRHETFLSFVSCLLCRLIGSCFSLSCGLVRVVVELQVAVDVCLHPHAGSSVLSCCAETRKTLRTAGTVPITLILLRAD